VKHILIKEIVITSPFTDSDHVINITLEDGISGAFMITKRANKELTFEAVMNIFNTFFTEDYGYTMRESGIFKNET